MITAEAFLNNFAGSLFVESVWEISQEESYGVAMAGRGRTNDNANVISNSALRLETSDLNFSDKDIISKSRAPNLYK